MFEWISSLGGLEKFYFGCAVLGGGLFLVQLALRFTGIVDFDGDVDGVDFDADAGGEAGHAGDTDVSFTFLSFQGLTSFFMMFGLVGLAMLRESGASAGLSVVAATVAGFATLLLMKQLFAMMGQLQSSGTIDLGNAIGKDGFVYLTIPQQGTGKVEVTFQGRKQVLDAMSDQPLEIATGEMVRVVRVEGAVLVVERKS